jgi:hypothetical protein
MPNSITVRTIRSREEIEEIRSVWSGWRNHPNSDIDYFLTVMRSGPALERPHIIVAYRDSCPDSMLVGRVESSRIDCTIGYKRVFHPKARVMNFVYGGLLGNPSRETAEVMVREIIKSLRRGEADVATFRFLRSDSVIFSVVDRIASFVSRDHFPSRQIHWGMTIGSTEEWRHELARKLRKTIPRWKKLQKDYSNAIKIDWLRGPEHLDLMIQDVEEVAKKTYQRRLGTGFVNDAATRERLHLETAKGWLRIYVLYLGGQPCAFWIGNCYGDTFYGGSTGYDPSYSKYSPGMFLMSKVMENFRDYEGNGGISRIDWGLGDAEYKKDISDCEWQEASVSLYAPTATGIRLKIEIATTRLIDRTAKVLLQRTGLLKRTKKIWRFGLAPNKTTGHGVSENRATHEQVGQK